MKKILTFVLAFAMVLGLCSCTLFGGAEGVSGFNTAFKNTAPTTYSIVTHILCKDGVTELNGNFNVSLEGNGGTITYAYDQLNGIGSGKESPTSRITGTATINGNAISGDVTVEAATAFGVKLKLSEKQLSDLNVGADTLAATVAAANTESVLGTAIDADVAILLVKAEKTMVSCTLTYTTAAGEVTATIYY